MSQLIFSSESAHPWPLNYSGFLPVAIDNDGRILLLSAIEPRPGAVTNETNLLLTPDGLSSAPLQVAAPEPGAWAIMILAIAGFAAHRVRDRREDGKLGEITCGSNPCEPRKTL